jgi:hypothetical protein
LRRPMNCLSHSAIDEARSSFDDAALSALSEHAS